MKFKDMDLAAQELHKQGVNRGVELTMIASTLPGSEDEDSTVSLLGFYYAAAAFTMAMELDKEDALELFEEVWDNVESDNV